MKPSPCMCLATVVAGVTRSLMQPGGHGGVAVWLVAEGCSLGRDSEVPRAVHTVGPGGGCGESLWKPRLSAWRAGCNLGQVSGARAAE